MGTPLRDRQISSLKTMFNFNEVPKKGTQEPAWKVLVYDRFGQDIISPLLKVGELRDYGITLHLLLHSDRDPIPDVPAIYFVMPTKENVQRICRDCKEELYDSFYLNFISAVPRGRLEELAASVLESNTQMFISKIFDQYLNFVSLENDLFTLRIQDKEAISYYALNNPEVQDNAIEASINEIVDSLFSVLVTQGIVPVIRSPRGNAAEMVAQKLDSRIRDHLKNSRNNPFAESMSGSVSFRRTLLVVLDRNMDIPTSLHHTWTYQALVHDLLDLNLNRVVVKPPPDESGMPRKPKNYDLDNDDYFWKEQRGQPFPTVASEVENELNAYKKKAEELTKLSGVMGLESAEAEVDMDASESTKLLTSAVGSLPELTAKKKIIDKHTTIASSLLDCIKDRQLDSFFDMEERLMNKATLEKPVLQMLQDPLAGTAEDKLRLYIMYYLLNDDLNPTEMEECETALANANADLTALAYLKKMRAFHKMTTLPQSMVASGGSGGSSSVFSSVTKK
eukprot:Nk52_evm1s1141 gene=Nk52_evmTU1s1141